MAVDLGTSFIKSGIYDSDSHCVTEASEPVKDDRPGPGIFIQRGEDLFASVMACMKNICRQLGDRAGHIEAIAFTGQMSGFMGVDKDWGDITTWSCSLDSRYMPYAQRQMAILKDRFLESSGTNFPQMAPKYEWFKTEFPEESGKIAKYLMISGYVIGRLGQLPIDQAVIDRSYLAWTGLADMGKNQWSAETCDAIGLNQDFLPTIVHSSTICGYLAPVMAEQIGLKSGIPLVAGAGDKIAGCLGAAAVTPGDLILEASSYGEISCCVDEYRPDMSLRRLDVLASAIPGEYYATHFAAGSGITLNWYVDTFVRESDEKLKDAFARIEQKAALLPPGSDGVMAVGLFGGSSMPLDGTLRGLWMGHDWSHRSEHFYRSLMESFTYDFALAMNSIERLYPEYPLADVKIVGGGAKSPLWPQMNADVTGKTYHTLDRSDVSMWGACILAGHAIGVFPDMKETARQHVAVRRSFRTDPDKQKKYSRFKSLYEAYLVELHDFYQRLQDCGSDNL